MQKASTATPAELPGLTVTTEEWEEVPVQLAGGGTWTDTSAQQRDGPSNLTSRPPAEATSPFAAKQESRHAAQLSVLLSDKPSSSLSAASSPKAAATGLGLQGTTGSTVSPTHSSTKPSLAEPRGGGPQASQAAAVLARLSLLASAPDAASMPGGWLTDPTAAGFPGLLGWEAAGSGAQASTAGKRTMRQHAVQEQSPPLQWDMAGSGVWGAAPSQAITVGSTGPPSTHWKQASKLQSSSTSSGAPAAPAAASVTPAASQGNRPLAASAVIAALSAAAPGSHSSRPSTASAGKPPAQQQEMIKGTAAFKGPDRAAASLAGRFRAAPQPDLPGPGQFRPLHSTVDKHVPRVTLGRPSSSPTAASCRTKWGAAGSAAHLQDPRQQHQRQGSAAQQSCSPGPAAAAAAGGLQQLASTAHRVSSTAAEAAGLRRSSVCTMGTTPRSADDDLAREEAASQPQGKEQQQRPRGGTAAFKAVSRDQAAAVAAGRGCAAADSSRGGGGDQQQGQQQVAGSLHHVRPVSRGVLDWSKQTARAPGSAPTSSPPALGPGSYFRSGALPASLTGSSCLAGHDPTTAAPDFGAAPSRQPGSSSRASGGRCWGDAAACSLHACCPALQQQRVDEPGLWGWAADDRQQVSQADDSVTQQACNLHMARAQSAAAGCITAVQVQQHRPYSGSSRTRPSSAALDYARAQAGHGAVLVAPAAAADDDSVAWLMGPQERCAEQDGSSATQQQQRRVLSAQRPTTVPNPGPLHAAAASGPSPGLHHHLRPGTAGATLLGGTAQPRPRSCQRSRRPHSSSHAMRMGSAPLQQPQHSSGAPGASSRGTPGGGSGQISSGTNGLGVQELQRYSSTGFAARVKGGKFPECGRDGAGAATAAAAGAELLYTPQPVQGHMRRAPGWALPPNRVETSRKWAQLAAQAALQ